MNSHSGHNGEDIVKIIRAVDSTTNPWLNLAAALLEALSRRRTSKYEPSYICDKSVRTKSQKGSTISKSWETCSSHCLQFSSLVCFTCTPTFAAYAGELLGHCEGSSRYLYLHWSRDRHWVRGGEIFRGVLLHAKSHDFSGKTCKTWLTFRHFSTRSYLVGGKTCEWPWHVAIPVILATMLWRVNRFRTWSC